MTTYVHQFISRTGSVRTLRNNPVRPGLLQVAQLDRATSQANMGWADYASDVSRAEYDAAPGIFKIDTRIVLYDADDPLNKDGTGAFVANHPCWAGFLDEPQVGGAIVRLGASGYGKIPDRTVKHWLWADYDTDQYAPTGQDSDFPYDSDDQIKIDVLGRGVKASVARKTEFRHPNGKSKLQNDEDGSATKIELGNVAGLKPGMKITIEGNQSTGGGILELAEYLVSQGWLVGGHPKYGGSGCCADQEGCHTSTSYHCRNNTGTGGDALDVNWPGSGEREKLVELAAYVQATYGPWLAENFHPNNDPDGNHQTHDHFAFSGPGGSATPSSPTITRTVADNWKRGNTTVKLTAALGAPRKAGTPVRWNPTPEGRWSSAAAGYYPGINLGGVRFDIDLPKGKDHDYELEVSEANGPGGARTVRQRFKLNKRHDDVLVEFPGNGSLALLAFSRDYRDETKNADHFVAVTSQLRTYGPFTTAKEYETWKIVRDVGRELNMDVAGVEATTTNGLPFKVLPGKASDALDAQAAVEDMVWLVLGGEGGPELKFRKWGSNGNRVWLVADPHSVGQLESLPSYDKLHVAFAHEEGFEDYVTMTASPNRLTGGIRREYPNVIFQGDRPPPLALAQAFGQPIIDALNEPRFFGRKNLAYIEDNNAPGIGVPPTRIRPGDKARHPHDGNVTLRINAVTLHGDGTVTLEYSDRIPMLERALARRDLFLNRGVRKLRATLSGLRLRNPVNPQNIRGSWKRMETRSGEHHFDARLNWNAVTEDVGGRAIFMRAYVLRFRYRDNDTGELIRDNDGKTIFDRKEIKLGSLHDDVTQLPTEYRLRNIRNPHKVTLEFQIDAISMDHKNSGFSEWHSIGKPTLPDPPQPRELTQRVDQHTIRIDFDCKDATENDSQGDAILDRGAGNFKIVRYMNGARYGKIIRTRSTHKQWDAPKHTRADTFTTDVYGEDAYGNLSTVASVTTGRGSPDTPTVAPGPFQFDRGGKKGIRGKLPFTYTGTDPHFHVHAFIIEWQTEDRNPTDADPIDRKVRHVEVGTAHEAQLVIINKLKAGEKIRARYYVRATKNGHLSGPSPWSTTQTVAVARKPGKARNRKAQGKKNGVLLKWDDPLTWDDGTTAGFSPTEVAGYDLYLTDTGGTQLLDEEGEPIIVRGAKGNHKYVPLPSSMIGSPVRFRADTIGWDDLITTGDPATSATAGTPQGITGDDIPAGAINYANLAGQLGVIIYTGTGYTTYYDTTKKRTRLLVGPTGHRTGTMFLNPASSEPTIAGVVAVARMYRFDGTYWWRITDGADITAGSLAADQITTGTLQGVLIQGSRFQTAPDGRRVVIDSNLQDAVSFLDGLTEYGQIVAYNAAGAPIAYPLSKSQIRMSTNRVDVSPELREMGERVATRAWAIARTHRHSINPATGNTGGPSSGAYHTHDLNNHDHGGLTALAPF